VPAGDGTLSITNAEPSAESDAGPLQAARTLSAANAHASEIGRIVIPVA
jgi:hypothetical protein